MWEVKTEKISNDIYKYRLFQKEIWGESAAGIPDSPGKTAIRGISQDRATGQNRSYQKRLTAG